MNNKKIKKNNKNISGQAMLMSLVIMGTSVILFAAVVGYMLNQRIRTSSDVVDSTMAIYAADSGIECGLYHLNVGGTIDCNNLSFNNSKTSVAVSYGGPAKVKSVGNSNNSKRSFAAN